MGFKFKRVDLVAGSEEWPTGNTDPLRQTRSEVVIKKCVQAIINCNCGWQLDATKNATINNLVAIPTNNSDSYTYPGLFLTNSTSGCKLFVAYFGESPAYSMKDFSGNGDLFRTGDTATSTCCGLCMSMIPAGSNSEFGDSMTSTFLPADATRIIGTVLRNSTSSTKMPFGGDPSSGVIYSWGLFVTPYVIAISCQKGDSTPGNLYVPTFAVGRVIGSLTHSTDTMSQAKYGCINFRTFSTTSSNNEGISDTYVYARSLYYSSSSSSFRFVGTNSSTTLGFSGVLSYVFGAISRADGTWVNGTDVSTYGVTLQPVDVGQLSGYVYNSTNSGKSRWCPFSVRVLSSDLDTYGVVPGDGMKGYLDTDLFRCAIGTYGQQFDNGNFICIDGDCNFLIGWDPDNDPLVGE